MADSRTAGWYFTLPSKTNIAPAGKAVDLVLPVRCGRGVSRWRQAMRSREGDWWHGDPLPMRFAGRFLVRNQRFCA